MSTTPDRPAPGAGVDPLELLRSPAYVKLLVVGALLGVPIAVVASAFLKAVEETQQWVYDTLPTSIGFDDAPVWWPLPVLVVAALIVAFAVERLPGRGGHSPVAGLEAGAPASGRELPGIALAALATLALGGVLGPEAPLIAIGGGLAALTVRSLAPLAPPRSVIVVGAAGSFAAISTLLGSPLLGAFLLMEAVGLGGPMLGLVLAPGLLAAGIGAIVFVGIDNLTGIGTFSLAIPDLPALPSLTVAQLVWAVVVGLLGAAVGSAIRRGAQVLDHTLGTHRLRWAPLVGAAVAVAAIVFELLTDRGSEQVLFSGEDSLAPLVQQGETWTAGALVLLLVCKSVAYGVSLAGLRGGPTFPAMFLGAAGGLALSHLPGLPPVAGVAMGIGAMAVTMLRLPLTSVLLTSVFLQADGLAVLPLVIISVVVAYVASARLTPPTAPITTTPAPT